MQNTRPMSGMSGFHPCTACNAKIPQEDKHTLCVRCLGIQHATLALKMDVACSICEAFQPRVKEARLERATRASSASSMAEPSAALGAPEPLLHYLSQDTLLGIPDAQAAHSHSPSPQARRVKRSQQAGDIMDLKAQVGQVLELLAKQTPATQAPVQAPLQHQLLYPPSPRGVQGGWEKSSQLVQEDTLSIAASGEEASFSSDMQEAFLQVPWTPVAEPRRSVFRMQAMAPRPQKFQAFLDFRASGPSMLKHAALLASLEGADKLGLAGFLPVDSAIAALVKAPPVGGLARDPACLNPQCKVTETHLKWAYAAEMQATHLSNTVSVLSAYLDGVLREAPLPEPVATELRLLSSTLLQILPGA
ncbi:UNVERIFIED_CONTAM: hypothetical protein FKN15_052968 [Acipenser sinensis]